MKKVIVTKGDEIMKKVIAAKGDEVMLVNPRKILTKEDVKKMSLGELIFEMNRPKREYLQELDSTD